MPAIVSQVGLTLAAVALVLFVASDLLEEERLPGILGEGASTFKIPGAEAEDMRRTLFVLPGMVLVLDLLALMLGIVLLSLEVLGGPRSPESIWLSTEWLMEALSAFNVGIICYSAYFAFRYVRIRLSTLPELVHVNR